MGKLICNGKYELESHGVYGPPTALRAGSRQVTEWDTVTEFVSSERGGGNQSGRTPGAWPGSKGEIRHARCFDDVRCGNGMGMGRMPGAGTCQGRTWTRCCTTSDEGIAACSVTSSSTPRHRPIPWAGWPFPAARWATWIRPRPGPQLPHPRTRASGFPGSPRVRATNRNFRDPGRREKKAGPSTGWVHGGGADERTRLPGLIAMSPAPPAPDARTTGLAGQAEEVRLDRGVGGVEPFSFGGFSARASALGVRPRACAGGGAGFRPPVDSQRGRTDLVPQTGAAPVSRPAGPGDVESSPAPAPGSPEGAGAGPGGPTGDPGLRGRAVRENLPDPGLVAETPAWLPATTGFRRERRGNVLSRGRGGAAGPSFFRIQARRARARGTWLRPGRSPARWGPLPAAAMTRPGCRRSPPQGLLV